VGLVNCIRKPQKYVLLPCFLREYSEIIFVLFCSLNGNCTQGTEEDYPRTNGDVTGSPAPCCNGASTYGDEQYSCRRQLDEDEDHLAADWGRTVAGVKEQAFARLQEELSKAHQELKLRDEEVNRLSRVREEVEAELEDLTASLFQVRGPYCML
jgi:Rab-3A-interacting protein